MNGYKEKRSRKHDRNTGADHSKESRPDPLKRPAVLPVLPGATGKRGIRTKEFNRAELQALETVQAETLQALESITDPELLASKAAYGDRALIDRITARAERIRRTSKQIA